MESRRDPVLTMYEIRVGIPFEAPPANPVPGANSIAPEKGSWLYPHRPRESPCERVCKSKSLPVDRCNIRRLRPEVRPACRGALRPLNRACRRHRQILRRHQASEGRDGLRPAARATGELAILQPLFPTSRVDPDCRF